MTPFQHGGDILSFAKKVGCKPSEVLDLSSNINFISPNVSLDFTIDSYPNYDALYRSLANHFQVKPTQMELFNGGSSAIFSLFAHLQNDTCVIYAPAYLEYKKATTLFEKKLIMIDRLQDFHTDIPENALVVFVNPSTPDGKLYDMKPLLDAWRAKNATIMIDESFLEFTDAPSVSHLLESYEKLYILKSLTKFHACAGVRVGIILSQEKNIQALKQKEPLWKISAHDSAYIQAALKDRSFAKRAKEENKKAKAYLLEILKEFEIIKGEANFVLVKLKEPASTLQERLAKHAIMIRECENFDFLDARYARIAVKSIEDLKRLKKALS